jgi:protein-disulfide isomerase
VSVPPFDPARDHALPGDGPVLLVYGDYECPYTRRAWHAVQEVRDAGEVAFTFAFRQFPLTQIHPHALAAAEAAEAAALQGRFWELHDLLFHRQKALEDGDLRGYAEQVGLDVAAWERDRTSQAVDDRLLADVEGGVAADVRGTPTIFLDGAPFESSYEPDVLREALRGAPPSAE